MNGKIMLNGKAYSSSGRPSKEITYAQWLALPDTKYTDGIVYYIKDVGGANQFPPLIYSDEEREVGVWRDGKPLYQKTVHGTPTVSGTDFTFSHGISNLDEVVVVYGIFHLTNGQYMVMNMASDLPHWGLAMNTFDASNIYGYIGSDLASLVSKIVVNVQYTKTTDTPGSGTWNTDGTYAKHYSTSEKVIGTWIDGKPLYEKTIQKTFSTPDREGSTSYYHGNVDISSDIPNLKHGFVVTDASYYGTWPNERGFTFGYIEPDGSASGAVLMLGTLFERTNFTGYITIRYTKTTD